MNQTANRASKHLNDPIWYTVGAGIVCLWIARKIPEQYWAMLPFDTSSSLNRAYLVGFTLIMVYFFLSLLRKGTIVEWIGLMVFMTVGAYLSTINSVYSMLLAGLVFVIWVGWEVYKFKRSQRDIRYLRILPHAETEVDKDAIIAMVHQLGNLSRPWYKRLLIGREWFRYMIHCDKEKKIAFYIGIPMDIQSGVEQAIQNAYPKCELHPVNGLPLPQDKGYGGRFSFYNRGKQEGLPLKSFSGNSEVGDICANMAANTWIELKFSPGSMKKMKQRVKRALRAIQYSEQDLLSFGQYQVKNKLSDLDPEERARLKSLYQRYTGREKAFDVSVSVWSSKQGIAKAVAARIATTMQFDNALNFHWYRILKQRRNTIAWTTPIAFPPHRMMWSGEELAQLLHLPAGDHEVMTEETVVHLKEGQRRLKADELVEGIRVGMLQHPIQKGREVRIPDEQFTKHVLISGKTGSGKTSGLLEGVQSLIDRWVEDPDRAPGFTAIDPARETVATILSRLKKKELEGKHVPWEKVHYFYLGPTKYPIGLNLLYRNGEPIDVIARNTAQLIKYAYANSDTPRMDRLLENALLTLLEDNKQPHNILGIIPVLADEDFQNRVLPSVMDLILRDFWKKHKQDMKREGFTNILESLLNRLSPLRTNPTMRRMFGQQKWSLDIRKYMDEGHIVLFDLLNVDESNIKLAMGQIITQYHYTAKKRSTGSKLHVMFCDECHLVQIPVMEKILAEDRKFGLSLVIITQYIDQLEKWFINAIMGNVGTYLSMTQGSEAASKLEKMTAGAFEKEFLQNLPERVMAVYTSRKVDGRSQMITCLAEPDPPYIYRADGEIANHKNVKEVEKAKNDALAIGQELQKRDGMAAEEVDRQIEEYLTGKTVNQLVAEEKSMEKEMDIVEY